MATEKNVNYTPEMVATMKAMYAQLRPAHGNKETVARIAKAVDRPVKSVTAKLVREGTYVKEEKPVSTASKDNGPSKKDLLAQLEAADPAFPVDGLMPATKEAIAEVLARVLAARESADEVAEEAA
jgi:hypothetical protein